MTGLAIIGGLLLAPVAAAGCNKPLTPTFEVSLGVQPVTVGSHLHVADLTAMAARIHAPLRHPAYGYYIGTFGYTIEVTDHDSGPCPQDVRVRVVMGVAARHIEIAQELKDNSCVYNRYLDHYRKYAVSDIAVITDYRGRVDRALHSMTLQIQSNPAHPEDQISTLVRKTIDDILMPLTSDRVAVSHEVDSSSEVVTLERGCSRNPAITVPDPI